MKAGFGCHPLGARAFWILLSLLLMASPAGFALYSDEIAVGKEEFWQAAHDVLEPYGIAKANAEKGVLVSRWIEDRVERRRGLLKNIIPQSYFRRYRIQISLATGDDATSVHIEGHFQEKDPNQSPAMAWHAIRPKTEEYAVERGVFMKILSRLEKARNASL